MDGSFTATEDDLLPILAELQQREPIFHRHASVSSQEDFAALMAPGYWEVGASGRRYSRDFILRHLADHRPLDAAAAGWAATGFACRQLGPDTFLLTYTLDQAGRLTRRATLWQRCGERWQILYHQGTLLTGEPDDTIPPDAGYTLRAGRVKQ